MDTNNKILNETNPVYNTAKMTLSILGSAGVPEALEYAEKLGLTDIAKTFDVDEEHMNLLPQAVVQETRYEFLNYSVRRCHCKNVMDLACGFSPRGYKLASEGYDYMGVDLEAGVNALSELASSMNADKLPGKLMYKTCDITDAESLMKLADEFNGPITIICEGLFMYLTNSEIELALEGVMRILSKHGGRFITPDFNLSDIYPALHIGILGQEEGMKALMAMTNKTESKSDTVFNEEYFKSDDNSKASERARKNIEGMGIKIFDIEYYHDVENCRSLNLIKDDETRERVRQMLLKMPAWKLKPANVGIFDITEHDAKPYSTTGELDGDVLRLKLTGRIDSITAADFLSVYESLSGVVRDRLDESGVKKVATIDLKEIVIDMTDLEYITSAGLRVLMMMKRRLGDGKLVIENVCKAVQEVLDCTGFESILG